MSPALLPDRASDNEPSDLDQWRFKSPPPTTEDRARFTDDELRLAQQIAEELWYGMDL